MEQEENTINDSNTGTGSNGGSSPNTLVIVLVVALVVALIALVALGVLYAVEFTSLNRWGRLLFVALTVPIAMVSNVLRITFLCLVADHWGTDAASGVVHEGSGYAIYFVALFLMIACGRLLAAFPRFLRRTSWATVS